MARKNEYIAKDCSDIFKDGEVITKTDDNFLSVVRSTSNSIYSFCISKSERCCKSDPVVSYDYDKKRWIAGRYIGCVEYSIGQTKYSLLIAPRFGETILMELFSEIFNVNLTNGKSYYKSEKKNTYVKMLISLIWSQKLANAIRYGLPRGRESVYCRGYSVKGRLMIKPSILSYGTNRTVVSRSSEVVYDKRVIAIISKAYRILLRDYAFEKLSISPNLKKAINEIESLGYRNQRITDSDYQSISYQPIYQSFKDLVDFSWQIINSSTCMTSQNHRGSSVSGYLIDMAEVWECYVRSLVEKHLKEYGWRLIDSSFPIYQNTFFKRSIIPDIVLEKDGEYCVFDAKYKRMQYEYNDVDREDLFQIHTYILYLQQLGHVRLSGLLYPVETNDISNMTYSNLIGGHEDCIFFADGPNIDANHVAKDRFFNMLTYNIS